MAAEAQNDAVQGGTGGDHAGEEQQREEVGVGAALDMPEAELKMVSGIQAMCICCAVRVIEKVSERRKR
jgi:hypothetical protein